MPSFALAPAFALCALCALCALLGLPGAAWAQGGKPSAPLVLPPLAASSAQVPHAPQGAQVLQAPQPPSAATSAAELPSDSSQRAFATARDKLLQVRTLLRGQDSQSSVGSGFLVTEEGHLITNYHVVSQYALRPQQFRLVYATADGKQGALQLLGVDVVHDLALLRVAEPKDVAARGVLAFRPANEPMQRGERIHSLGNPLDVGFAVMGGAYNGLVERSYLPTIFFGGSLSGGMSGGPAVDDKGRVMGVNVAARRDGEQVSFLVPAEFAQRLLASARTAKAITESIYPKALEQVMEHQEGLTKAFLAQSWRPSGHAHYAIPVPQEKFMRCWGQSTPVEAKGLMFERSDCAMDNRLFISGGLQMGHLHIRHEAYDGKRLGWMRFAERYSKSFRNEGFGQASRSLTAPQCHESSVWGGADGNLPLRAVMCLRGYKKLPGLYELSLLVATLDGRTQGAQGRMDVYGVSFSNAQRLAEHYLRGFGVVAQPAQGGSQTPAPQLRPRPAASAGGATR